jgi:hypothetical protein
LQSLKFNNPDSPFFNLSKENVFKVNLLRQVPQFTQ